MSFVDDPPDRSRSPVPLRTFLSPSAFSRRGVLRTGLFLAFFFFCFAYGMLFAFFAPYLILPLLVPIVLLMLLAVWALPASRSPPVQTLEWLFYAFLITLVAWPNYLAIALPGLPWITLSRLTGIPMIAVLLLSLSTSADFRTTLAETLGGAPLVWKFLAAFVVIQLLSIAFSHNIGQSIDKFIIAQTGWTAMFFASCYLFLKPGRVVAWSAVLWGLAIIVGLIGLDEFRHSRVPWSGHIPALLKVSDPGVLRALAGQVRSATGAYRVESTFSTSLGLAEYIALTLPFILHFLGGSYRMAVRLAAAISVPFLLYIVNLTDSRLGVVGCLLTILFYPLAWAALEWRRRRSSLLAPAVALSYPVVFVAAVAAVFSVGRLRAKILGNGPQQASTDSRIAQYKSGLPMVLHQPWGHGVGMGADTLGFSNPNGIETIDTYYLMIALEYGIVGFILYYGMLLLTVYYCIKYSFVALEKDRDASFLVPIAISIMNFFVIKSVFSQQDNHPLIFMMMGIATALIFRIRETSRTRAATQLGIGLP